MDGAARLRSSLSSDAITSTGMAAIEIGLDRRTSVDANAGDAGAVRIDRGHTSSGMKFDAQLAKVLRPGVDPDIAGGAGEKTIEDAIGADQAIQQLQLRDADGARAAFLRAHRHQGARDLFPQIRLIGFRHARRRDKVPPGDLFELRQAPLGATGSDNQQPGHEKSQLVFRNTERSKKLPGEKRLQIRQRLRAVRATQVISVCPDLASRMRVATVRLSKAFRPRRRECAA